MDANNKNPLQPESRRVNHLFGFLAPGPAFWPVVQKGKVQLNNEDKIKEQIVLSVRVVFLVDTHPNTQQPKTIFFSFLHFTIKF